MLRFYADALLNRQARAVQALNDLSYPARIRTWTKRAKISCAAVTLPGIARTYGDGLKLVTIRVTPFTPPGPVTLSPDRQALLNILAGASGNVKRPVPGGPAGPPKDPQALWPKISGAKCKAAATHRRPRESHVDADSGRPPAEAVHCARACPCYRHGAAAKLTPAAGPSPGVPVDAGQLLLSRRFLNRLVDDSPPGLDDGTLAEPLRAIRNGAVVCVLASYALKFRRELEHNEALRLAILEDLRQELCAGGPLHAQHHKLFRAADGERFLFQGRPFLSATAACYALPHGSLWAAWDATRPAHDPADLRDRGLEHVALAPVAAAWDKLRHQWCDGVNWWAQPYPLFDLTVRATQERGRLLLPREQPRVLSGPLDDEEGRILAAILAHPEESTSELAERLGMSRATLNRRRKDYPRVQAALDARKGVLPGGFRTDKGVEAVASRSCKDNQDD